jgi:hypothetical protein
MVPVQAFKKSEDNRIFAQRRQDAKKELNRLYD